MTAHSYASRVCYSQGIADVVQASDGLKAARLLGASSAEDIGLLPNTTEGVNIVSRGLDWRTGDNVAEQVIALGDPATPGVVAAALSDPDLLTMHTREATLEDVFLQETGRSLQ